ncbi:MAG: hypothetical protein RI953_585 [Pseudomonadota bacterium]|jgi:hypothetical protein
MLRCVRSLNISVFKMFDIIGGFGRRISAHMLLEAPQDEFGFCPELLEG